MISIEQIVLDMVITGVLVMKVFFLLKPDSLKIIYK